MTRTTLTLALTFAMATSAFGQGYGDDEGLPLPSKTVTVQQESITYDELMTFVAADELRVDTAAAILKANLTPEELKTLGLKLEDIAPATDPLSGSYKTNPRFTRSSADLTFEMQPNGTYLVMRTYKDGKGVVKSELRGEGRVSGKKTFFGLTRMLVKFHAPADGAANKLRRDRGDKGGTAEATYRFKPSTGMIKESFYKDGRNARRPGSNETKGPSAATGWKEGAAYIPLDERIGDNFRHLGRRIKGTVKKVAAAVRNRIRIWRKAGAKIGAKLVALKDKIVASMIAAGKWTWQAAITAGHWTFTKAVLAGQWAAEKALKAGKVTIEALVAAGHWTVEKAIDLGHWTVEAAITAGKWTVEKAIAAGKWTAEKAVAAGKWTVEAAIKAGKWTAEGAIKAGKWTVEKAIAAGVWTVETAVKIGRWTAEKAIAAGKWTVEAAIALGHYTVEKAIAAGRWTVETAKKGWTWTKEAGWTARRNTARRLEALAKALRSGDPKVETAPASNR
jgi:hypothetical protein